MTDRRDNVVEAEISRRQNTLDLTCGRKTFREVDDEYADLELSDEELLAVSGHRTS